MKFLTTLRAAWRRRHTDPEPLWYSALCCLFLLCCAAIIAIWAALLG